MTHCVIDYKKNNKVRPNEMNSISFRILILQPQNLNYAMILRI